MLYSSTQTLRDVLMILHICVATEFQSNMRLKFANIIYYEFYYEQHNIIVGQAYETTKGYQFKFNLFRRVLRLLKSSIYSVHALT